MITLREIAAAAGYSIAVVSRVLSPCPHEGARVAEKTREHIRAVALQLGYRPNRAAEFLKRGGSPVIGVYVPDSAGAQPGELVKGICLEAGLNSFPLAFFYDATIDGFQRFILETINFRNSGVIAFPAFQFDERIAELVGMYCGNGGRMVMINNLERCAAAGLVAVDVDDFSGGAMVAERLLVRGSRRFLTISNQMFPARHEGFCRKIEAAGKKPEVIAPVKEFNAERIVAMLLSMHQNKSNLPLGIFAGADPEAVEIITMLAKCNVKIGRDILIAGYGDQYLAAHVHPGLTTVAQPFMTAGRNALNKLSAMIYGKEAESEKLMPELIIRGSA
ncbi:MAG: LacI family DNA-binding transcriptional regulator [Victivallaceae bacterium]|jgi:LacI family transcriptional regulator